ncbi:MAG: PAS domain S-box protein [Thermoplasmatota archaeon]
MNILIVDDEQFILEQSKYYLEQENEEFCIDTVSSSKEGVDSLKKKGYDIIVSDYQMPGMNGLDFLKVVQEEDIDTPFIMFTGRGREEVAIQALNMGADRYVQKRGDPVSQYKVLASAIKKTVEHRKAEKSVKERRKKIEALHKISTEMEKCRSEQEVYDLTVDAAENILDFFVCSLLIQEDEKMVIKASKDPRVEIGEEKDLEKGIYGLTFRDKRPFIIDDLEKHEQAEPTDPDFKSVLSIPVGDIGVFQALSKEYDFFDTHDHDMTKLLISHTAEVLKRIRYDKARRKSEEKYRNIVENSLDIIYSVDVYGNIKYVSPQIRRFGYEPDEILGKNIDEFLYEKDRKRISEIFTKAIKECEEKRDKLTFRFKKKDDDIAFVEENSNIVKEDGEIKEITGVLRDVTEREEAKQRLKEGKEEYKNLFRNSPVGLWSIDYSKVKNRLDELNEEGHDLETYFEENEDVLYELMSLIEIKDVNSKVIDMYQADSKEELFDSFNDIYTEVSMKLFKKLMIKISDSEIFFSGKDVNYTIDGGKVHILLTWSVVPGHEENYDKVYVSTQDITDKTKTKKELIKSRKRFRTLYENIPSGTMIIGEGYRIKDVNKRTCEITGYSRKELIGELCDIVCPKGSKSLKCPIYEEGKEEFKGMDTTIKCKGGDKTPILKNAKTLDIEDELLIIENFQDIRHRKRFEEKILKEKEKIEKLHDVANSFEQCKSEERVHDLVIEAAVNILGFDKLCSIEVVEEDQIFLKAISKEEEKVFDNQPLSDGGYVKKTYENNRSYLINDASKDEDAEPVRDKYKSCISIPIGEKGVFQAIGFDTDDFDKEDLELAELLISHAEATLKRIKTDERLKFLNSLLRHDLNNKNQIVKGYLQLVQDDNLLRDDIKLLKKAEKNTNEGIELIEKIKILSELEEEEITNVNIGKIIDEVVQKIFSEEYSNGFNIEVDKINHLVKGGSLLYELFSNIVTNTIIHSEGNIIKITSKKENGNLVISVEDNGKGIPEEIRDKIFDKGFKKGSFSGSGLGLYLVKKISQYYGGSISLKDSDMGGTRFDVRLKSAQLT